MAKKLLIDFLYRDAANYKTRIKGVVVDTAMYPEALKLKVEDQIEMGEYDTPSERDFFATSENGWDGDLDHNLLEIEKIAVMEDEHKPIK